MEITQDEILRKYQSSQPDGKEPIRLLHDISDIDGWSNIPPYMRMIITQLNMLDKEIGIDIIENEIIRPYLTYGLSVNGYAREQFRTAHTGLIEQMKPILAGLIPEDSQQLKRDK